MACVRQTDPGSVPQPQVCLRVSTADEVQNERHHGHGEKIWINPLPTWKTIQPKTEAVTRRKNAIMYLLIRTFRTAWLVSEHVTGSHCLLIIMFAHLRLPNCTQLITFRERVKGRSHSWQIECSNCWQRLSACRMPLCFLFIPIFGIVWASPSGSVNWW